MKARALGVGLVWCPQLDDLCREGEGLVDVIEAEPETFWIPAPHGFQSFLGEALRHLHQPKLLHGVGASIGGTCSAPIGHEAALSCDVLDLKPEFVSEHLSFTQFRPDENKPPVSVGFMLPPVQSHAGVSLLAANIRRHRESLGGTPLAVETPVSYLPPARGEWPDSTFVAAVAEAADCGVLLDLHNVLCNARNQRQSAAAFCGSFPLSRVWELHLGGGEREGEFFLDAHAGLVEPELMEIAAELVPRIPHLRAIIFEIMPERVAEVGLAAIGLQLERIRELWNTRGTQPEVSVRPFPSRPLMDDPPISDPKTWEMLLGCALTGLPQPHLDDAAATWWRSAGPAVDIYRLLAGEGRASAALLAAPLTTRLLLQKCGRIGARQILAEFWRHVPPSYTAADEADSLFRFLSEAHSSLPGLMESIALDKAELARLQVTSGAPNNSQEFKATSSEA